MMLLILIGLFGMMALVAFLYHRHQNTSAKIGGKISSAKSFWLAYAFFHYFIYPIYFYCLIESNHSKQLILIVAIWFYLRMMVQGFMMFVTLNWSPQLGIGHNVLTSFGLIIMALFTYWQNSLSLVFEDFLVLIYIFNLALISFVDTIYAYRFGQIVGDQTKGKEAIWYASNDDRFNEICRLTKRNNYAFLMLSLLIILAIVFYDTF